MKIINSSAKIDAPVSRRLYETYIINPVRMQSTDKSAVHSLFADKMPEVVKKIEAHEKFYKNRETRYDIEPILLLQEMSKEGYTVCTFLIDDDAKYDRDMCARALRRICNRSADWSTFRLVQVSDVISANDWKFAIETLKTYASDHDTIELYATVQESAKGNCQTCAHKEVCKYIFMNKPLTDCQYFLTV